MSRRTHCSLIAMIIAGSAAGCAEESETIIVTPHKIPCLASVEQSCMVIIEETGSRAQLYGSIYGFELTWGLVQEVTVRVEPITEGPMLEGITHELTALDITTTEEMEPDATFQWDFRRLGAGPSAEWFTPGTEPGTVIFFGDRIACAPEVCEALLQGPGDVTVDLTYGAPAGHVATAQRVNLAP